LVIGIGLGVGAVFLFVASLLLSAWLAGGFGKPSVRLKAQTSARATVPSEKPTTTTPTAAAPETSSTAETKPVAVDTRPRNDTPQHPEPPRVIFTTRPLPHGQTAELSRTLSYADALKTITHSFGSIQIPDTKDRDALPGHLWLSVKIPVQPGSVVRPRTAFQIRDREDRHYPPVGASVLSQVCMSFALPGINGLCDQTGRVTFTLRKQGSEPEIELGSKEDSYYLFFETAADQTEFELISESERWYVKAETKPHTATSARADNLASDRRSSPAEAGGSQPLTLPADFAFRPLTTVTGSVNLMTLIPPPFTVRAAGATNMFFWKDSDQVQGLHGKGLTVEQRNTENRFWTPEPFACYRHRKLLGIWDPTLKQLRAAVPGEAPAVCDDMDRPASAEERSSQPNTSAKQRSSSVTQSSRHSSREKAASYLNTAKMFLDTRPQKAREYAAKVVDLLPDSDLATEAKEVLEKTK
jgi:hypothetical protein